MLPYPRRKTPGDTAWFIHDRFGMFIHFGLYALPARHEWIKSREYISEEHYKLYFDHFNPDLLDARAWAKSAKAAGMKYAVLTTKHHEGFCLFDTKYTDYKVTNTPYGKDIVREFVDAFRAEGLRVGFYYSLIDWHHPEFPIDYIHPRRKDPDAAAQTAGRDMKKYTAYMRDQVRELLTNYGKIDILWFDFSYGARPDAPEWMWHGGAKGKDEWEAERLIALARELQPGVIINNRTQLEQDLATPEQEHLAEMGPMLKDGEALTWETCQTFSGSWGYFRDETSWKTPQMLLELLIRAVSKDGNLIMNVGPTGRGYLDERAEKALAVYADWMKYNDRSIYGCTAADPGFKAPNGTVLTQSADGKRLYLHLLQQAYSRLYVDLPAERVEYVQLLSDASELPFATTHLTDSEGNTYATRLKISLPGCIFGKLCPVVEIFLRD